MAQGVSGYLDFSTNVSWATVRVHYSQTYDIESNTSVIKITKIQSKTTNWYGFTWYLDGVIKVGNTTVVTCNSVQGTSSVYMGSQNTWYDCSNTSGQTTVSHNADGTASITITVDPRAYSGFFWHNDSHGHQFKVNAGSSKSVTLTTIPRSSSITSVSNVNLGSACSIKWTPNSSTFGYKIKFSLGNWNATTNAITPKTASEYTYTGYTLPLEAAKQLPSATSGTMTATLYSYSDEACKNAIGSTSSKTFTVSVPSTVIPEIDTLSATIDNSSNSVVNGWGIAVAGYTKVKVTATANGTYGSSISSFSISGGYSKTLTGSSLSWTGGIISSSGDKSFDVTCKDSRGRTSTQALSNTITFYAYSAPKVTSFSVYRNSNDSSKVTVKANWSFASVNGKNTATAILKYKKSTESGWQTYGAISKNVETELDAIFENVASYNFKIIVTDALSETGQEEAFISTMEVLLDFRAGGKGLGIGKICESDAMEVSMAAKFFGDIFINGMTLEEYIRSVVG